MNQAGRHSEFRFERKFLTTQMDSHQLETVVLNNPGCFREIFEARQVNNLYFDTPDLRFFEDNVSGRSDRIKVRIRWYGSDQREIHNPVLEFKIKEGLVGRKSSYDLPDFRLPNKVESHFFIDLFRKSNIPPSVIETLLQLEPVLINGYSRKYFQSFDRNYRFTIDQKMKFFDYRSLVNGRALGLEDYSGCVLELKYNREFDSDAGNIIGSLPIRITKSSKYVSGLYWIRPYLAV